MSDKSSPTSDPGNAGREPGMIDLPLRHRQPSSPPRPPSDRGEPAPSKGPPTRAPRRRRPLAWLLPLGLVALGLWWLLWPAPARVIVSETLLSFDTVRVGLEGGSRSIAVGNAGERALRLEAASFTGEGAADFAILDEDCVGRALRPGDSCQITLAFRPIAAGRRTASLTLTGRARNSPFEVALEARALAPSLGLAPASIDFGTVAVGDEGKEQTLTISNVGSAPLELGRIRFDGPQAAEFDRDRRCPKTTLEPGDACTLGIRFAPAAAGERLAELVITSDDPEQPARLRLRGEGAWTGPPLEAQPDRLDLGEQRVGRRSRSTRLRLINRTAVGVEVSMVQLVPDVAPFEIVDDGCRSRTVASGESCEIGVAARPGAEGPLAATLEVLFVGGVDLRVPLTVRGVQPRLRADTGRLDFGSLRAGFESAPQGAVFTNTGSATLTVERVRLVGSGADGFVIKSSCRGDTIAPGKRCTVEVAFRPPSAGGRSARLELTPSDDLEPLTVALEGAGIVAALAVAPGRLVWDGLQISQLGSADLVMTNTGTARLQVRGLRITGEAANDFRVGDIGCRLDDGLAPNEECRLSIRFSPALEGEREAVLEVAHDAPGSPFTVGLAGVGLVPRPVFNAAPRDFGFGSVTVGGRSDIATLTISNPGGAWLRLRGVTVGGVNASDFELVPGTCDGIGALAPNGRCTIGLRFTPKASGRRGAMLEIRHDAAGSPAVISLAGIGS